MIESLIERHFRGFRARNILDVGPGYSQFSRLAARITGATTITFLDCDKEVLEWQASECKRANISAEFISVMLDAEDLSRVKGSYDIIHCQELLEHLPNAKEVLLALRKILAPGGRMIITVPTKVSERLLKFINSSYMKDELHGHVNEFDRESISDLIRSANLSILSFIPTQPHYFLSHLWLFGSRMNIEGSTGKVLTGGVRGRFFGIITSWSRTLFLLTGPDFWGRLLPRNYFIIVAEHR